MQGGSTLQDGDHVVLFLKECFIYNFWILHRPL